MIDHLMQTIERARARQPATTRSLLWEKWGADIIAYIPDDGPHLGEVYDEDYGVSFSDAWRFWRDLAAHAADNVDTEADILEPCGKVAYVLAQQGHHGGRSDRVRREEELPVAIVACLQSRADASGKDERK